MSPVRGHEAVHSDDGTYHIRLGVAITQPKTKIPESSVEVFHGIMLKPKQPTPKPAVSSRGRMVHPPPWFLLDRSEGGSDLEDRREPEHVAPADSVAVHPFEPRARLSLSPRAPEVEPSPASSSVARETVAPVYEEGDEIIIKIFTVARKSWSRADTEIKALKQLTASKCQHAPTYLGDFNKASGSGGVVRYVLMSKLPGCDLAQTRLDVFALHRVWKAFDVAIKAVHDCGVDNGSHMGRNILWSELEDKCYIVDFERATFAHSSSAEMPALWSNFNRWNTGC